MKTIVKLIAFLYLVSCSTEPIIDDVVLIETGQLSFAGSISAPETARTNVPDCSGKTPDKATIIIIDENGKTTNFTKAIAVSGTSFDVTEALTLDMGNYTLTDFYLTAPDGTIVFAAPDTQDTRYPFASYVENPLPFDFAIAPEAITQESIETLCYTTVEVNYTGENGWDGSTDIFLPMTFLNYGCDAIIKDDRYGTEYPAGAGDAQTIPVRQYNTTSVSILRSSDRALMDNISLSGVNNSGVITWSYTQTSYIPDTGGVVNTYTRNFTLTDNNYMDFDGDNNYSGIDSFIVGESCF